MGILGETLREIKKTELVLKETAIVLENANRILDSHKIDRPKPIVSSLPPDIYRIPNRTWVYISERRFKPDSITVPDGLSISAELSINDIRVIVQIIKAKPIDPTGTEIVFVSDQLRGKAPPDRYRIHMTFHDIPANRLEDMRCAIRIKNLIYPGVSVRGINPNKENGNSDIGVYKYHDPDIFSEDEYAVLFTKEELLNVRYGFITDKMQKPREMEALSKKTDDVTKEEDLVPVPIIISPQVATPKTSPVENITIYNSGKQKPQTHQPNGSSQAYIDRFIPNIRSFGLESSLIKRF